MKIRQLYNEKLFNFLRTIIVCSFLVCCMSACSSYQTKLLFQDDLSTTDYSNMDNWASHPMKKDSADIVSKGIDTISLKPQGKVNIFYLHPTTLTSKNKKSTWNASLGDVKINAKTEKTAIKYQASIFNTVGNIYAPRYRQAHIRCYFQKEDHGQKQAFDLAYRDVKDAFLYFIENYSKDTPFMIVSHSQGTTHAARLVNELVSGKPIQKQLVVAYLVGLPVPKNAFRYVKPCESPDETNCFCSWRTYKKGHFPKKFKETGNVAVTNPVSWTTGWAEVSRQKHKGAIFLDFNKLKPKTQTTKIESDFLWANKPKFRGSFLYFSNNFHAGDYNLFYKDIRDNAVLRLNNYLEIQQTTGNSQYGKK